MPAAFYAALLHNTPCATCLLAVPPPAPIPLQIMMTSRQFCLPQVHAWLGGLLAAGQHRTLFAPLAAASCCAVRRLGEDSLAQT